MLMLLLTDKIYTIFTIAGVLEMFHSCATFGGVVARFARHTIQADRCSTGLL